MPAMLFPAIIGCLMAACSSKSILPASEQAPHLPEKFTGDVITDSYEPLEWWKTFNDPALDRVIEAVLVSNFDLAESVARVEQAWTRARIANAVRYPMLQPSAGAEDTDTPTNAGVGEQIDEIGLSSPLGMYQIMRETWDDWRSPIFSTTPIANLAGYAAFNTAY